VSADVTARTKSGAHSIFTIPSSDLAFAEHVNALYARQPHATPLDFERRLRTLFPRVVVRERSLSGELASWYVYRDGSWRPRAGGPWWLMDGLPTLVVSEEGWVVDSSRTAADLLGITDVDGPPHHFTDFVVAGGLDDAMQLFDVVKRGRELEATIVLRPVSGEVIAVEVHAARDGDHVVAVIRLADDVDIPAEVGRTAERPSLTMTPATDVAFRGYAARALERMPEPTPSGLELRLRRLYPHASVVVGEDGWFVYRDSAHSQGGGKWWLDAAIARVRYDTEGLILEANEEATAMFGRQLVGHHWQEFVTPGSSEQVAVMLEILAEAGAAESRFRMPRSDGSLLEFDSYTEVAGDEFKTAFRPVT
jgi:PAS domain-containing protein